MMGNEVDDRRVELRRRWARANRRSKPRIQSPVQSFFGNGLICVDWLLRQGFARCLIEIKHSMHRCPWLWRVLKGATRTIMIDSADLELFALLQRTQSIHLIGKSQRHREFCRITR